MSSCQLSNEKILKISDVLKNLGELEFNEDMYDDKKTSRSNWQKFAYAISRNEDFFISLTKAMKKLLNPSKKYMEYNTKRLELAQKYADLDKDGKPIIFNNNYVINTRRNEFESQIEKIKDEYKECIEEQEKRENSLDEILEREEEVQIYQIKSTYLPLTLTASQLNALQTLIDGEI